MKIFNYNFLIKLFLQTIILSATTNIIHGMDMSMTEEEFVSNIPKKLRLQASLSYLRIKICKAIVEQNEQALTKAIETANAYQLNKRLTELHDWDIEGIKSIQALLKYVSQMKSPTPPRFYILKEVDEYLQARIYDAISEQDEIELENLDTILKGWKTNIIDVFSRGYLRGYGISFKTNDPLLEAIIDNKLKSAKCLLAHCGSKINDKIQSEAFLTSKSMAELLISHGYKIPSIESIFHIEDVNEEKRFGWYFQVFVLYAGRNPSDGGLAFIKFVLGQGSDFNNKMFEKLKIGVERGIDKFGQESTTIIEALMNHLEKELKNTAQ